MTDVVFFEDVSDDLRHAALAIARQLASAPPTTRDQLLHELTEQSPMRELVLALTERIVRDLAAGRHPVYTTLEDEVTPAEAARLLGVSRQFVDRLLADGRLPFTRKPGSTHRRIRFGDVERLMAERERRRTHTDRALAALAEGGLEY